MSLHWQPGHPAPRPPVPPRGLQDGGTSHALPGLGGFAWLGSVRARGMTQCTWLDFKVVSKLLPGRGKKKLLAQTSRENPLLAVTSIQSGGLEAVIPPSACTCSIVHTSPSNFGPFIFPIGTYERVCKIYNQLLFIMDGNAPLALVEMTKVTVIMLVSG